METELLPFAAPVLPSRGFTIIELMVTVAIAAVVLAAALPSFRSVSNRARLVQTGNDLLADLGLARTEAVKRSAEVILQAKGGNWNTGWEVRADTNLDGVIDSKDASLRTHGAPATGYAVHGVSKDDGKALTSMTFTAFGNTKPVSGKISGAAQLSICPPDKDKKKTRVIELHSSGSVSAFTDASSASVKVGC